MEKDLKTQNIAFLIAIYVGTFCLIAIANFGLEEAFRLTTLIDGQASVMIAITAFGGVLSNILPNSVKHKLIFFRLYNVLPGHRCRRICAKDSRLSLKFLQNKWSELFVQDMAEDAQNSYWYKEIYLPVRNAPEVSQAHRSFLLYRDAASGLFILLLGLSIWQCLAVYISLPSPSSWSLIPLIGIILFLILACRQSGNRMVTNAVAVRL